MSRKWEETTLGEVAAEVTVGYVGPMASEYVPEGIPFLRSLNVRPYTVDFRDIRYISPEFHQRIRKSALRPGDVVTVRTGKPGTTAVIPRDVPVANCSDVVITRPGPNLDARWLAYYFNGIATGYVSSRLVGAVQQHFNVGAAKEMRIFLPPISEQRAIASVLGGLDDKIALNRRIKQTLEAVAMARFDEAVERARSDPQPGWTAVPFDEAASFLNGLALQKYPAVPDEDFLPVIKIRELRQGLTEATARASTDVPAKYVIEDGDLLFSWSGTLEVVRWSSGRGALNQHLFKVTSELPQWFIHLWLLNHLPSFRHTAASKATTMGHIQRKHLTDAVVLVPPADGMNLLGHTVAPLYERAHLCDLESRTLAELRETLLPKLLSGELRVRDAEKVAEALT